MASPTRTSGDVRRDSKDALFQGFASIASALASGRRAEIVEILAQGERTVDRIAGEIGQSVANTSHHLRALARAGLVNTRRQGTHVHYRLASEQVAEAWLAIRSLAANRLEAMDELARAYLGDREDLEVIGIDELRDRLGRGEVLLVDVRPQSEYLAGHLPGAVSVPPDDFGQLDSLLDSTPANREIVAYCRGPFCVFADDAIRHMARQGRTAVRLEEGVPEWRRRGGVVET